MIDARHDTDASLPCRVDVAVIGGGPAGSAVALALARAGVSVLMVDRGDAGAHMVGESLPPAATPLLRELGVWEPFLADGHLPSYGNRSVWGGPEPDDRDFFSHPEGVGWHLDRPRFDAMLSGAAERAGAAIVHRTRALQCHRGPGGAWRLDLSAAGRRTSVRARIVVDASGRARLLARAEHAAGAAYDRLVGVVGVLVPGDTLGADEDSFTLIEAVRDGWWYAARVPGDRLVVAYMTDADIAAAGCARTADGWTAALAGTRHIRARVAAYGYRLGTAPRLVATDSSHLREVGGDGWWAIGDAAAAHDPLSSCGLTTALTGGMQAARAILACGSAPNVGADDLNGYTRWMRHMYAVYLAQWLSYYALEQRWPDAPFWHRRHALLAHLLAPDGAMPQSRPVRHR